MNFLVNFVAFGCHLIYSLVFVVYSHPFVGNLIKMRVFASLSIVNRNKRHLAEIFRNWRELLVFWPFYLSFWQKMLWRENIRLRFKEQLKLDTLSLEITWKITIQIKTYTIFRYFHKKSVCKFRLYWHFLH
jgi:hypothetical protein